jgi:Eco47II restriction endonuclease
MPKLSWISDANLDAAVTNLLKVAQQAKQTARSEFGRNVIDPFSAIFEMSGFNMSYDEWVKAEESRQAQKTLQNFIGGFHQTILGSCHGWVNMNTGNIIDLHNKRKKIIAEVKNKYNTVSGGKLADLYWSLESAVMNKTSVYKNYSAYHVSIIPSSPTKYNKEFTPSDKEKGQRCPFNPLIRQIDGASFYQIVTGDRKALENLFDVLPSVIADITQYDVLDRQKLKGLFKLAYG